MKAVGYIRVSTAEQSDDGVSIEAQEAKIQAWCVANDHELVSTRMSTRIDKGISGHRSDNRPELMLALDSACAQKAAFVVYSLSRLARNTRETLEIGERLAQAGADLVSLSEKIDTTSAAGKMVFRMLAVLAEFERDQISERTKTAMSYLRSQGRRISGRIPYGFDLAPDGVTLRPNTREQKGIQLMKDLRGDGKSLREIASIVAGRGYAPKSASKWHASTVNAILGRG